MFSSKLCIHLKNQFVTEPTSSHSVIPIERSYFERPLSMKCFKTEEEIAVNFVQVCSENDS